MATTETISGKRERAPAEGAMDSAIPTQSVETEGRLGDLHLAFVMDKGVAKEHARRRRSDMKEKIDMRTRKDPGVSFSMDFGGPVLSAWAAEERSRIPGQELPEVEERAHADLARMAKDRNLEASGQFKVSPPVKMGSQFEDLADTPWVLT